jgi:sugar lactone lactonase YvrE
MTAAAASEVELVLDARAELGEGPLWDARAGCLVWVDIMRGLVHLFRPHDRELRTLEVGQPVGAAALRSAGGLVLALRDGFAGLDTESGRLTWIAAVEADRPDLRMNDGTCDAAGRFWAGTMALDERRGAGALYRLGADGRVEVMLREVTVSNGLDWSLDGRSMYYVDSPTRRIDVFDHDPATGAIANRRPLASIPKGSGFPDGLTVDADGFVWLALWAGGALHRYAPDGSLHRVIELPVSHPTSCAFGGPDLTDLYVTTASIELSAAERDRQVHAGGLFRCRPGVAGRAPHRFAG